MNELHLLTQNKLHTEKANSLVALFEKKVIVPTTIIFQDDKKIELVDEIIKTIASEYFYVRINFPDNAYPHHLSSCSHKENISNDLESFIKKSKGLNKNQFDIIIQPILNFQWSGVALVRKDLILIEIVFGHPISLLRLGEYKFRFLFDKGKNLLDINEGVQSTYMEWKKNELIKSNEIIRTVNIDQIITELKKIRGDEIQLYEFGFSQPDFYYLEFKSLNPKSFPSLSNNVIQKPFIVLNEKNNGIEYKKIKFANPSLENLKNISIENDVIIENGALLSHFSTYSAFQNINCVFLL